MLNENSSFLTDEQLRALTSRLNRDDLQAFDAEWEVAVLNAFSKSGKVSHELDLSGTSKLDLFFVPSGDQSTSLAADITTVSDDGYERDSPVNDFYVELSKRIRNVTTGGFNLRIGSEPPKEFGRIPKILLPPRREFHKEIFNAKFKAFLKRIKENPDKSDVFEVRTQNTSVYLSYQPGRRIYSSEWTAYRIAQEKDRNPVFNALKSKHRQLKNSGYSGTRGIILCDGGTNMFAARQYGSFEFFYSATDAIKDFFRQNKSVDFVLLVSSVWTEKSNPFEAGQTRRIQVQVFGNEAYGNLPLSIRESLENVNKNFPEPCNTAGGARDTIKLGYDPKALRPLASGLRVSSTEVSVFSSTVIALLAGIITQDEFEKSLGFKPSEHKPQAVGNVFAHMLDQKMRISEISVKETPHDDHWLVFKFDGPDAAISDFVCPRSVKATHRGSGEGGASGSD
jgi:hypothetical protein